MLWRALCGEVRLNVLCYATLIEGDADKRMGGLRTLSESGKIALLSRFAAVARPAHACHGLAPLLPTMTRPLAPRGEPNKPGVNIQNSAATLTYSPA